MSALAFIVFISMFIIGWFLVGLIVKLTVDVLAGVIQWMERTRRGA